MRLLWKVVAHAAAARREPVRGLPGGRAGSLDRQRERFDPRSRLGRRCGLDAPQPTAGVWQGFRGARVRGRVLVTGVCCRPGCGGAGVGGRGPAQPVHGVRTCRFELDLVTQDDRLSQPQCSVTKSGTGHRSLRKPQHPVPSSPRARVPSRQPLNRTCLARGGGDHTSKTAWTTRRSEAAMARLDIRRIPQLASVSGSRTTGTVATASTSAAA